MINWRFTRNVAFDFMVLWPAIYIAIVDYHGLGVYAERIISFFGVMLLVVGVAMIFPHKGVVRGGNVDNLKMTTPHHSYAVASSVIEISVFAALGWYWVAGGFTAMLIAMMVIRQEIEEMEVS
jgi:hypothetical protein